MATRIEEKLDKISDKIGSIEVTLASQHASIQEHIKRSNMLEDEIKPIKRHVALMEGAAKVIALAAMLATIVEVIHMVFK